MKTGYPPQAKGSLMMKTTSIVIPLLFALAGAAQAQMVSVQLKTAEGADAGSVTVTESPAGVLVHVEAKGLTPGWHAMHFHEKGDCSDPKLANAGGHINMIDHKREHGLLAVGGPDHGDLPNLYVAADGTGKTEVFSPFVSLRNGGGRPVLLDADGSALIIHANPDDYTTQPIGGAGARVACAVLK